MQLAGVLLLARESVAPVNKSDAQIMIDEFFSVSMPSRGTSKHIRLFFNFGTDISSCLRQI